MVEGNGFGSVDGEIFLNQVSIGLFSPGGDSGIFSVSIMIPASALPGSMQLTAKNPTSSMSKEVVILMRDAVPPPAPAIEQPKVVVCDGEPLIPVPTDPAMLRSRSNQKLKVLSLAYYPLGTDNNLDAMETGIDNTSLQQIRDSISTSRNATCMGREESTKFVRKADAQPCLDYEVVNHLEFLKKVTPGLPYNTAFRPDHNQMLKVDVNICDFVDNQEVNEVWVWMYHTAKIEPAESNLSMGMVSSAFFNYSGYGDISNSERTNDLPQCQRSYTVYEFNYGRGVAENLHNYGHHSEALFRWVDNDLFWTKFVGRMGSTTATNQCGWTHFPPNVRSDYAYESREVVQSSCNDWQPDAVDANATAISCAAWDCDHAKFMVWWFQRHPGYQNGINGQSKKLRNWHEFFANLDLALQLGKTLYD